MSTPGKAFSSKANRRCTREGGPGLLTLPVTGWVLYGCGSGFVSRPVVTTEATIAMAATVSAAAVDEPSPSSTAITRLDQFIELRLVNDLFHFAEQVKVRHGRAPPRGAESRTAEPRTAESGGGEQRREEFSAAREPRLDGSFGDPSSMEMSLMERSAR